MLAKLMPTSGRPLVAGIRLAVWNALYIAASMLLVIGCFLFSSQLSAHAQSLSIALFYVTLLLIPVTGIIYLYGWLHYILDYAALTHDHKSWKTFTCSLIGVAPNLIMWLGYPVWVKFLPGAEDDSCGGILFFAAAYLVFAMTSLFLPFLSTVLSRFR